MFKEYDIVKLKESFDNLKENTLGTVLIIHDSNPPAYEIEFCNEAGETLNLLTIEEKYLELYKQKS